MCRNRLVGDVGKFRELFVFGDAVKGEVERGKANVMEDESNKQGEAERD